MASSTESTLNQPAAPPSLRIAEHPLGWPQPNLESRPLVNISPPEIAKRHSTTWSGFRGETVEIVRHTPFEYGFRAPWHLLIAAEVAELYGASFVEGLPRSTLRDFTHKLTFVPAGHASISIRAGLSPIPRCGLRRSNSSRACSFTIAVSGKPLLSSSR
ncbi:hypothetical protein IVA96_07295 [Bradyrhizobium sp. 159]|uniref:hypothetical protein n=1 Tax=Bradyrhizobium sp. 159 TaxID=2782632 RepID=UPI001FFC2607|nr:hypothetical protein [Bradyrhizobium sp. 159]MCK1616460.1 hypothetical protein [Bradyrhizobium sp. 159]